jgi:hypothetical protein
MMGFLLDFQILIVKALVKFFFDEIYSFIFDIRRFISSNHFDPGGSSIDCVTHIASNEDSLSFFKIASGTVF